MAALVYFLQAKKNWQTEKIIHQAPVVQKLDRAIHRINLFPVEKCQRNQMHYQLDRDLYGG